MKRKKRKYKRYTDEERLYKIFDQYFAREDNLTKGFWENFTFLFVFLFFPLGICIRPEYRHHNLVIALLAFIIYISLIIVNRLMYLYYRKKKRDNILKGILYVESMLLLRGILTLSNFFGFGVYVIYFNYRKFRYPLAVMEPKVGILFLLTIIILLIIILKDKQQKEYIYSFIDKKKHIFRGIVDYVITPTRGTQMQWEMLEKGDYDRKKYKGIKYKIKAIMIKYLLPASPLLTAVALSIGNNSSKKGGGLGLIGDMFFKLFAVFFNIYILRGTLLMLIPLYYITKYEKENNVKMKCHWNEIEEIFWKKVEKRKMEKEARKQQRKLEKEKKKREDS